MRRILVIGFALVVLAPSIVFAGRSEYLCRLDGELRSACCCPPAKQEHQPPAPAVRGACCCTILEAAPARVGDAVESHAGARAHHAAVIASPPPPAGMPVGAVTARVRRAAAPIPRDADSLFVRHCAWLL